MTNEEIKARADAAERKRQSEKSKEYYWANRERVLNRMKQYDSEHRKEGAARCKKYRDKDPVHYAEVMVKYWERKLKEAKEAAQNG